jgi:hypothetical protein
MSFSFTIRDPGWMICLKPYRSGATNLAGFTVA